MKVSHRDENGQLIDPVQVGSTPNLEDLVTSLGKQLTQEKLEKMQYVAIVNGLGAQVVQMKLEMIAMKGGET